MCELGVFVCCYVLVFIVGDGIEDCLGKWFDLLWCFCVGDEWCVGWSLLFIGNFEMFDDINLWYLVVVVVYVLLLG